MKLLNRNCFVCDSINGTSISIGKYYITSLGSLNLKLKVCKKCSSVFQNEIVEEQQPIKEASKEIKKTDYNIFYSYYTSKLKEENQKNGIKKENKVIKDDTIAEWNRLKKNKRELELLMISIKNKT